MDCKFSCNGKEILPGELKGRTFHTLRIEETAFIPYYLLPMLGITDFNGEFQSKALGIIKDRKPNAQKAQLITKLAEEVAERASIFGRDTIIGGLEQAHMTQVANGGKPTQLLLIVDIDENRTVITDAISGQPIFDIKTKAS